MLSPLHLLSWLYSDFLLFLFITFCFLPAHHHHHHYVPLSSMSQVNLHSSLSLSLSLICFIFLLFPSTTTLVFPSSHHAATLLPTIFPMSSARTARSRAGHCLHPRLCCSGRRNLTAYYVPPVPGTSSFSQCPSYTGSN